MYTSDDSVQTVALPATATVTELILALGVTEAFDLVETLELAGGGGGGGREGRNTNVSNGPFTLKRWPHRGIPPRHSEPDGAPA